MIVNPLPDSIGKQIRYYRKQAHLTQRDVAEKLGISETSVSNWERGQFVPTQDNLVDLAVIFNVPISKLYSKEKYTVNERIFDETQMEKFVQDKLEEEHFTMSLKALEHIKETRSKSKRIGNDDVPYIYHPLLMVCQAFAMGIATDEIVASCLLHDAVDCGTSQKDFAKLGVNATVRKACETMARNGTDADHYFERIATDPVACLIKCLSRCSNLSTMSSVTDKDHRKRCLAETEKYYGGLLNKIKAYPEWHNAAWLLSYQIKSLCEAHKQLG